ncbi:MAG TPA: hypothetical protein VHW95_18740 [Steroidobacteraceae bacterium]|jgi:hypothetical protein|nr:hypothetical protein [Steroidobacteraceae bacterium]
MSFDVLLIAVLVGGIALSVAYVGAEYRSWRAHGAAQRRSAAALRDLHAARLAEQHDPQLLPSVLQMQEFGADEAANPDQAAGLDAARRGAARADASRVYPFSDRRKRVRQRAS